MKKIRRLLFIVVLGLCNVFAFAQTETTIDFSALGYTNLQVLTSTTVNPITVTYVNGNTNGSKCAYYTLGTAVRIHSNNGIIVSTNSGNITKIVFTFGSGSGSVYPTATTYSVDGGTFAVPSYTWTGSASSISLSYVNATKDNWRLQKMVVTTVVSDLNDVAPPTITGTTPFLESTNVTLSAADGTSVYYTTDGSEPTNTSTQYTASFSINTTSTIKAIAYINGNASLVASKDFSQVPTVDNIAAFKALSPNTIANLTLTNAQVLNADATNTRVYVRDNSGAICFYNLKLGLTTGDLLTGSVAGSYSPYNNLPQMNLITGLTNSDKITKQAGTSPQPVSISVADALNSNNTYVCDLVKLSGVSLDGNTANLMANQGSDSILLYDGLKNNLVGTITKASTDNNVTGILILSSTTYEIYPISIEQMLSVSNAGYATMYYSDRAFTVPAGVTSVTTYKMVGSVLTESVNHAAGDVIPAGEAVVVEAPVASYAFNVVPFSSATADANSMLKGTDAITAITAGTGNHIYKLSLNDAGDAISAGFYWDSANGLTLNNGAHRAYLEIPTTASAKRFYLFDGTATGVDGVQAAVSDNAPTYNLVGQRVNDNYQGVVIKNGKKYINK